MPLSTGSAAEILHAESHPLLATVGLRVDPASAGKGADFRLEPEYDFDHYQEVATARRGDGERRS